MSTPLTATSVRGFTEKQVMSFLGVVPLSIYVLCRLWTNLYSLAGPAAFDATHELAIYALSGEVQIGGAPAAIVGARVLGHLGGGESLHLRAGASGARVFLLGGPPMPEPTVAWWNFVVGSTDEGRALERDWAEGRRFPKLGA